jgi:hypothetical protein
MDLLGLGLTAVTLLFIFIVRMLKGGWHPAKVSQPSQ